jgi:hypothetical protein
MRSGRCVVNATAIAINLVFLWKGGVGQREFVPNAERHSWFRRESANMRQLAEIDFEYMVLFLISR